MFEKRLHAFSYGVGITFLILFLLNLFNFAFYSLMHEGVFAGVWPFCLVEIGDMARYMLNLKLMSVFVGTVFLVSYFWLKKLRKIS